jgi:hypothetical protein
VLTHFVGEKMCLQIPVARKAQHLCNASIPCRFYLTDPKELSVSLQAQKPAHPELEGLVVIGSSGKEYRSIERAASSLGPVDKEKLGRISEHFYTRKGFHREWRDCRGQVKEVYGRITKCGKSLIDGRILFAAEFDESACQQLKVGALLNESVPSTIELTEEEAWGGYLSFLSVTEAVRNYREMLSSDKIPFHIRYIVPRTRFADQENSNGLRVVVFFVKGFRLELEAKESAIPNSGLGLWARCTSLSPFSDNKLYLELEKGEVVDLGVYAPHQVQDFKRDHGR